MVFNGDSSSWLFQIFFICEAARFWSFGQDNQIKHQPSDSSLGFDHTLVRQELLKERSHWPIAGRLRSTQIYQKGSGFARYQLTEAQDFHVEARRHMCLAQVLVTISNATKGRDVFDCQG